MAEKREVYGYPVIGTKPVHMEAWPIQRPGSELVAELATLITLGADHVTWTQYTPHFNDGEPCTFRAHDIQVYAQAEYDEPLVRKVLERVYEGGRYTYTVDGYKENEYTEVEVDREYEIGYDFEASSSDEWPHPEFLPDSPVMEQAFKVNRMIISGAYDHFLSSNFGDGIEVAFDGEKFTFDDYSHE